MREKVVVTFLIAMVAVVASVALVFQYQESADATGQQFRTVPASYRVPGSWVNYRVVSESPLNVDMPMMIPTTCAYSGQCLVSGKNANCNGKDALYDNGIARGCVDSSSYPYNLIPYCGKKTRAEGARICNTFTFDWTVRRNCVCP